MEGKGDMSDRYSLDRHDKKIGGVCSTLGDVVNVDPTILRIGFVAVALVFSWKLALVAYIGAAIYFAIQRNKAGKVERRESDFDRMAGPRGGKDRGRVSVHDVRTKLDATDRRLMAIDHHLASQKNHDLAREIEALREDK
jgi:phage shock protein C